MPSDGVPLGSVEGLLSTGPTPSSLRRSGLLLYHFFLLETFPLMIALVDPCLAFRKVRIVQYWRERWAGRCAGSGGGGREGRAGIIGRGNRGDE